MIKDIYLRGRDAVIDPLSRGHISNYIIIGLDQPDIYKYILDHINDTWWYNTSTKIGYLCLYPVK